MFAAGAIVVPVLDGMPRVESQALIIEPPKVEPVKLAPVRAMGAAVTATDLSLTHRYEVTVTLRDKQSGLATIMKCESFVVKSWADVVDVTESHDLRRKELLARSMQQTILLRVADPPIRVL